MLDKISELFGLAYREKWALAQIIEQVKEFMKGGHSVQQIIAGLMVVVEMAAFLIFEVPMTPRGEKLDLTGYELVFCDEFEGTELDTSAWNYRALGDRRSGYNAESQVEVKDGNLVISGEYLEDGTYGAGWYAGMIALTKKYNKGYFEIKCKCADGGGFWSAFWIQADNPYDHYISKGGVGGAELDIFEAMNMDEKTELMRNGVTHTIHCNGSDDDVENIDSCSLGTFRGNNIYNEFNTYGLKWTDDEYIFYINGVETTRSSFANGVSEVPEEVIVSLEIPSDGLTDISQKTQFVVDYVKIYQ